MRVALIVDNPNRDLPGLLLVAMSLCQQGVTCYLVPMNLQAKEVFCLAPDFILLNFLRKGGSQAFAHQLLDAGIRVGVLDTEGGVLRDLSAYAQTMASDPAIRRRVTCYCSWGTRLADHAITHAWFLPQQIVVTGAPRFDFYSPLWREAALGASAYAEKFSKPLVLVNGNFPVGNPAFSSVKHELRGLMRVYGFDQHVAMRKQQKQREGLGGLVELTNRLARRFPTATFVYRPHPFERLETYADLLESRDNMHLVKKGTVDGWILRASAVIQRSCSTAIEAGLAGVPALSPTWIPVDAPMEAAEAVSLPCATEDVLADRLDAILSARVGVPAAVPEALNGVIEEWFYRADGQAHRRVAEVILARSPRGGGQVSLDACRHAAYGLWNPARSWRGRLLARIQRRLARAPDWPFRQPRERVWNQPWQKSEKSFGVQDVQSLLQVLIPVSQVAGNGAWRLVRVYAASPGADYHFGYRQGRSVALAPA